MSYSSVLKVKRGRQKGDGKKSVRKCHDKSVPFPSNPILSEAPPPRPLPLMSSEVQKRGKLVREVRGPKDKTNGRERDALSWHFLSRPLPGIPFWPSPNFITFFFVQVVDYFGSAKTDPVRFKWGFGEGLLKDKVAFVEAYKSPIPKRRKLLAKRAFL